MSCHSSPDNNADMLGEEEASDVSKKRTTTQRSSYDLPPKPKKRTTVRDHVYGSILLKREMI